MGEHAGVERGDAVEDVGLVLAQALEHRVRRGALGHQHRGGTDRKREGKPVAEAVCEEELGRREHHVLLADAQHLLAVQLGGVDQVGVDVHRALGRAGGAGGVEPETGIARMRRHGLELLGLRGNQGIQAVVVAAAGDHQALERRHAAEQRGKIGQQRLRNHRHPRTTVREHVFVVALGKQRVHRDRHHAGLDGAEEHRGKIDAVEDAHQHTFAARKAERAAQRVAAAVRTRGELVVGVAAGIVDVGDLAPSPGDEVATEQVIGRIVRIRNLDPGRRTAVICRAEGVHRPVSILIPDRPDRHAYGADRCGKTLTRSPTGLAGVKHNRPMNVH